MTATISPEPVPDRGARRPGAAPAEGRGVDPSGARSLFDGAIVKRAASTRCVKLDPRTLAKNPVMFVVEVGSVLTTILFVRDLGSSTRQRERVRRPRRRVPVVHRAVRQLRRGDGRGPRQGAGRDAAQDPQRDRPPASAAPTAVVEEVASSQLHVGDLCVVGGRRGDPR